jgi:hypothetical protein
VRHTQYLLPINAARISYRNIIHCKLVVLFSIATFGTSAARHLLTIISESQRMAKWTILSTIDELTSKKMLDALLQQSTFCTKHKYRNVCPLTISNQGTSRAQTIVSLSNDKKNLDPVWDQLPPMAKQMRHIRTRCTN